MPEFYRNAWYAQLKKKVDELQEEIEKAIELPSVTSADDGKVLTVDNNGKWVAEDVPKELPSVTSADEGKVLTVDNNGAWSAETLDKYSTDEIVIGKWIDGKPVYRKVIDNISFGNGSTQYLHGIGIKYYLNVHGYCTTNNNPTILAFPIYQPNWSSFAGIISYDPNTIELYSSWSNNHATVILEYTKSSDYE